MEQNRYRTLSVLGAIALLGVSPATAAVPAAETVVLKTTVDRPLVEKGGDEQRVVVKIEVEGAHRPVRERMPLNLAIVLDRSGSMSGAKLEQAKQAALMLVDQLGRDDVISLVLYESEVEVAFPAKRLGNRREEIRRLIQRIQTGGSTALYGGVECGGRQLEEFLSRERINRVMLLSDGIANVGPSSNREIAGLGTRLARKGMSVTTIGLGNDYNETLMTALAEASDANYYYVADVEALPDVFRRELGELKTIVAHEIEIEIRCPAGVRPIRFLGRPGELKSQRESLVFGTLSSEQKRELYLECAIAGEAIGTVSEIVEVSARYLDAASGEKGSVAGRPVVVGYTDDVALAEKSVDQAIVAESVIYRNAMETEKSVAFADRGDVVACRENLASQKAALSSALLEAPAAQRQMLEKEIAAVEDAERDLQDESLSKEQRKKLTSESFQFRNSKR